MTGRITLISWQPCPSCGRSAAVGWAPILGDEGDPIDEVPVDFYCGSGCALPTGPITAA